MGGLQRFEQRLEKHDLRRLRPRLPLGGATGRDRRGAPARVRQQRPDPVPRAADGAQRLPRRAQSPSDLERLAPYDTALADELTHQVQDHADAQGYVFPGPIAIDFEAAEDLVTGRFRIRSRAQARVQSNATHTQVRRARAVLEINGTKHPLTPPGLVVGRGTEADVRINDPGVSRRHVEFEVDSLTTASRRTRDLRIEVKRPRLDQRHPHRRPQGQPGRRPRRQRGQGRQHHDDRPDGRGRRRRARRRMGWRRCLS